jgi:hypothetical protein
MCDKDRQSGERSENTTQDESSPAAPVTDEVNPPAESERVVNLWSERVGYDF